jgi:hypothetical protein
MGKEKRNILIINILRFNFVARRGVEPLLQE